MKQSFVNCVLLCSIIAFVFVICIQKNSIENLRKELKIVESTLNEVNSKVVEYEARTQRLLDMNFTLLSNGGWENFEE